MISPLLTDLYQLTMAFGYWKLGLHDRDAVFHIIFRKHPFRGNYAIAAGLADVIEFIKHWHFSESDLGYLAQLKAPNGELLFSSEFIAYLRTLRLSCDIDAVPEGNIVFAHEPLVRIKGPLLQAQLLESTLLNIVNFQTLIATKSSRVCQAAKGDAVLEFGMRRAQGPDGALAASRAAYIGGCAATSNVLAGKMYDIPVSGTHAHSWVTAFPDEMSAFEAYASVMPHNCILLVDTFDTIEGVKKAIEIGKRLRERGSCLRGVRLDSGDLCKLSIKARELLDAAGLQDVKIIASNSLDEYVIEKLKQEGAAISVWGVGTNLVTAYDQPALDGVYKLSAIADETGKWQYKLKLSEQAVKISNPGIYQTRRFFKNGVAVKDVMFDVNLGVEEQPNMVSLSSPHVVSAVESYDSYIDMLQPIFVRGKYIYQQDSIHVIRDRAMQQVQQFLAENAAQEYKIGLEEKLHKLKQQLIHEVSSKSS